MRVLNIHDEINIKHVNELFKPVEMREGFGEEFILGDYKLSKDPKYLKFYKPRACFVKVTSAIEALNLLLNYNGSCLKD